MFFKNKNLNIISFLVLILVVLIFVSMQFKTTFKMEGFSGDLINLEKFATTKVAPDNNIQIIKTDVADIKISFAEADFWITRKGSIKEVGRPTKDFNKEKIGIKTHLL